MANTNQYATLEQLKADYSKAFLIKISNFEPDDDYSDYVDSRLIAALRDASDIMDGYLMGRYATPVIPSPDWFKPCCEVIAVKLLIQRKGYEKDTPEEGQIEAAKDCIKKLEMISQGKMDISLPDDSGTTGAVDKIQSSAPDIIFTETELDKY